MSFDGIVVKSLVGELREKLIDSKIDKVYQPEKDEVCLKIRSKEGACKLLLSASASHPRVYIANKYEKTNPKKAPVFCMTLRKYIQGGVIVGIDQVGFERIIKISVESYDELREKTCKDLYIEIMGKHSNIILVSDLEGKVIDSIKRVPLSVSRARQVLPGVSYELPPSQDKLNPLDIIDVDKFTLRINRSKGPVFKAIYGNILGLSPLVAREVCVRVGLEANTEVEDLSNEDIRSLVDCINTIFDDLDKNKVYPSIIIDKKRDKIVEFSSIRLSQYKDLTEIYDDSISTIIEDYYLAKDKKDRINQRASSMKKNLSLKLDRVKHKIDKQMIELNESENADKYRIKGELITSYIYMIKEGMDKVVLENFYDNNKEIEIDLRVNLSPSENAQKYFKKYNKLKNAGEEISKQMVINIQEKEYLENTLLSIENCDDARELKEIREELIREGYIKSYKMPKKDNKPGTDMRKFRSYHGKLIIVGKNNKQNDYLTLRLADNEDLWFHTKDIPGSHVLIKSAGMTVTDEELIEAATLAAYYSKARMSSNVPVDYTMRKNVKKPSGAKPGMVIYEKNKTIYVTPSDEAKAKIKQA
ncbi:fibronectin-binding protein [Peptostreptococcus sp. MV1]|uniref:Rqc2 family fibronectin-binding protein n=1 Tax=Peptostreptococcus sp. MV1 TaxID=1219626 RepID=UPI00050DBBF1|nr:NFACT RNA binding domain-containing protein [Peptostreptococcus sp. MV1]KGF13260.1 fibronectin-binding protein [Peptostreptococcus sp. MV1]